MFSETTDSAPRQAPLVLAVDDEPSMLRLLSLELSEQGFEVLTAQSGREAVKSAESRRPDIVLLDVMMPDADGLHVLNELRRSSDVSVIFLTARDSESDKVRGLELGADDYIAKPVNPEELAARIRAVLRRRTGEKDLRTVVRCPSGVSGRAGRLTVDLSGGTATVDGRPLTLTRTEWLVLQHLAANCGRVVLNSELLTKVWGPEYRDELQYLRVWISRLRRKIEDHPQQTEIIRTLHGIGYILDGETVEPEPDPAAPSSMRSTSSR